MESLIEYLKTNKPAGFTPRPHYSAEGDSLTFFFEDKPYYGERIDDFLTAYRAMDGHGLIGCQIKGLPKALELLGSFGLSMSDGTVTLRMIFIACIMAQSPQPAPEAKYKELGEALGRNDMQIPQEELVAA